MKLAVVGAGRMGGAVLAGALRAGVLESGDLGVYHPEAERRESSARRFGVAALDDAGVHAAERVLIAVKPQSFERVAPLIAQRDGSYISLMAGVTVETMSARLGSGRVVRAMPNLGARVGASATALTWNPEATDDDRAFARSLFAAVGTVYDLPERLFDAFTGLSGSGPAFAAVVAESLADGGVRVGFGRDVARDLARQVLLATARLLEEQAPADLKDEVASAGGTAIAGLRALERHRLRFALIDAIEAASERATELASANGARR
ncbi:pyrroline-5-carboxylate reductase [soil metagenome]|nr:pyrroline-5-carboxylate reductase [Trueperaceae bacterium]